MCCASCSSSISCAPLPFSHITVKAVATARSVLSRGRVSMVEGVKPWQLCACWCELLPSSQLPSTLNRKQPDRIHVCFQWSCAIRILFPFEHEVQTQLLADLERFSISSSHREVKFRGQATADCCPWTAWGHPSHQQLNLNFECHQGGHEHCRLLPLSAVSLPISWFYSPFWLVKAFELVSPALDFQQSHL